MKYKCMFLLQGSYEPAAEFALRLMQQVSDIQRNVVGLIDRPICLPLSDGNGRKEVMIQWYVTTDIQDTVKIHPEQINLILNTLEQQKKIHFEASSHYQALALAEGFDLCMDTIRQIFLNGNP